MSYSVPVLREIMVKISYYLYIFERFKMFNFFYQRKQPIFVVYFFIIKKKKIFVVVVCFLFGMFSLVFLYKLHFRKLRNKTVEENIKNIKQIALRNASFFIEFRKIFIFLQKKNGFNKLQVLQFF